tara:strand:+ start:649 stop:1101 length:453 start_codon:yes stop_codon:yes gene_type:complete
MKIKIIIYLFLFFLTSCGYQPLYSSKGQTFSIGKIEFSGDKYLINNFDKKIKRFQDTKNKIFDLEVSLNETKNTVAKDKKGNPSVYSLTISAVITFKQIGREDVIKTFSQNTNYNNNNNKFNLKRYEKRLSIQLIDKIFEDFIFYSQSIL